MFLSNRGSFRPETSGAYTLRRRGRRRPKSGSAIGACAVARLAGSGGPIGDYYGSANISCRNILGLSKTYAPALLERACAKLNAASALPSYTGLKNAILAIKSSDAEERAKGRPVGAAGSGELVDRAKSAGRLRGADAYKRGGE